MLGTYHLNALFDILNKIHFIYEPQKLWDFVLENSCQILQAEAGTFYTVDESKQELRVTAAKGVDIEKLRSTSFRFGNGLCGWVAQYQQPALVPDTRRDPRFNSAIDRLTGFSTRSLLAVSIFSQGHNYGVVELLNKKNGVFNSADQEFLTLLGRQAAVAYQNLLLREETSKTAVLLESLLENMPGGFIAADAGGKLTLMNPAAVRILDWKGAVPAGLPAKVAFLDWPWIAKAMEQALAGESLSRQEAQHEGPPAARFGYTTVPFKGSGRAGGAILFQKLN